MKMMIEYTTFFAEYTDECLAPAKTKITTDIITVEQLAEIDLRGKVFMERGLGCIINERCINDTQRHAIQLRTIIIDAPTEDLPPIAQERLDAWLASWHNWLVSFSKKSYWIAAAPKPELIVNSKQTELSL